MYQDNKKSFNKQQTKSPIICIKQYYNCQDEQAPKFILKGNNNINNLNIKQSRPLSALDISDDDGQSSSQNSYLHIYNQQKRTSQFEICQQQKFQNQIPNSYNYLRKQDRQTDDYLQQQTVSEKLKSILSKQANGNYSNNCNNNQSKTLTQNTNNSIEISQTLLNSQVPKHPLTKLNVFNNKAHSVDIIPDDEFSPQIYQQSIKQNVKKDKRTASKSNNQTKLEIQTSELKNPNISNQFSELEKEQDNLKQIIQQLQNENLTLICIKFIYVILQLANIKKLNLTVQEQKQENKNLQNELKQCKLDFSNQYDQMSRTIDLMKEETVILNAELKQKDQIIHGLNLTICDVEQQLEYFKNAQNNSKSSIPITNTSKEIDEIKNRIIARKNTNRTAREMIQNASTSQEILDEIDSSARKDLKEFKKQIRNKQCQSLYENIYENKENDKLFQNQIFEKNQNKFKMGNY